jgi:hypothetical protein
MDHPLIRPLSDLGVSTGASAGIAERTDDATELTAAQCRAVAGGLNPQPLPPRWDPI